MKKLLSLALTLILLLGMAMPSLVPTAAAVEYPGTIYPVSPAFVLDGKITAADEWVEPFAVHTHTDGQKVEYYYAWDADYCYIAVRWISAAKKEALLTLRNDQKSSMGDVGYYKDATYNAGLTEGEDWKYTDGSGADGYEHMYEVRVPWSRYNKTGDTVKLLVEWYASGTERMSSNGEVAYSTNMHVFTLATGEGGETPVETEPVETEPVETEPAETEPVVTPDYSGTIYPASENLVLDGRLSADEWGTPFSVHTHTDGQQVEYYYAWDADYCYIAVRWVSAAEKEALLTLRNDQKPSMGDVGYYKDATYNAGLTEGADWNFISRSVAEGYEHMYEVRVPWSRYNRTDDTVKLLVEWYASGTERMSSNGEVAYSTNMHTLTLAKGEPVETQPVETEPVETEPVETKPVETEPVETEPVETEPVETEPVETEPVETEPVETEPVETEPVETQAPETKPTVTESGEPAPGENVPAETTADTPETPAEEPTGTGVILAVVAAVVVVAVVVGILVAKKKK